MPIRFATDTEVKSWNDLVIANPDGGNILQGREFLEQKAEAGWKIRYILVGGWAIGAMEKHVQLLGKVWYIPKGPSTNSLDDLVQLKSELMPFAKKHGVFSIKIEPELMHDTDMSPLGGFKTSPVQYNFATVLVDLSPSLDDILAGMNQKGRHAVRRAERDGVTVKAVKSDDENCKTMYDLLAETGKGARFAVRPPEYYKRFYQRYGKNGQLFFAYFEGRVVAGAFAMVQGKKSMYKDGASVRERPAYGASHLLQWHVIQWAKKMGSLEHDLAGAPPLASVHDKDHPFYNIGRFKRQFNDEVTEYVGAYNVPVKPLQAKIWDVLAEKLVRKLYFMKHHESYY
jgi:lipid II:glycine glycyltransferase (peptidoglycan interpeptide bridge formation enzyme)